MVSLLRARPATLAFAGIAVFLLYFQGLTNTGMLSADEPRYASIGREMARSGDWVTPRLWGEPWFEKPALLYWMTGLAYSAGLPDDWAPRLPVALVGAAFLVLFWRVLRQGYDERTAWYATATLGTSAGWLAYSHVAVTDIPVSVCFGAAMLLIWRERGHGFAAGVLLGFAALAKGLVPYALVLPAIWFLRKRLRYAAIMIGVSFLVALPWYALVIARNGMAFVNVFFVQQHLGRLADRGLAHGQPFWFYVPVILGLLFPWSPLVVYPFGQNWSRRESFLLAWAVWVVVFFSIFLNKLPGYLLPALPALCALLGFGLARAKRVAVGIGAAAAFVGLIPVVATVLPQALAAGLSKTHIVIPWMSLVLMGLLALALAGLELLGKRDWAVAVLTGAVALSVVYVTTRTYPVLDRMVSSRQFWREHHPSCSDNPNRSWRYGLNYYAGKIVPDCDQNAKLVISIDK